MCGASAALATATVLPKYANRDADTVFTVVAVNALSTVAMVAYPAFGPLFGFDDRTLGILLGATIHDVAQVVGSGYSVSEPPATQPSSSSCSACSCSCPSSSGSGGGFPVEAGRKTLKFLCRSSPSCFLCWC